MAASLDSLALRQRFTQPGAEALDVVAVMGGAVTGAIGSHLVLVALSAYTPATWLDHPTTARTIDRASGSVFVALGLMTSGPVLGSWV